MIEPKELDKNITISWKMIILICIVVGYIVKDNFDKNTVAYNQVDILQKVSKLAEENIKIRQELKALENNETIRHSELEDKLQLEIKEAEERAMRYSEQEIGGLRNDVEDEDEEHLDRIKILELKQNER